MKKLLDGAFVGAGFIAVVTLAFAIAYAGDVFTVDKDGTLKFAVNDQGKITVGATESYVNLVIQNNAAAANNKVDITADVLTVEGIRLESVNVSADITASGAGGLDTGSEAANTWYYVWAITNNTGTSTNGLLSISSTSPTMPSGFTRKRRVGTARNNASGNFYQFAQEGNRLSFDETISNLRPLSLGQATSWTDVSLAAYVPPTSRRAIIMLGSNFDHNVAEVSAGVHVRRKGSSAGGGGAMLVNAYSQVANIFNMARVVGDLMTDSSQVIQYMIDTVPSNNGGCVIDVFGYYDRI